MMFKSDTDIGRRAGGQHAACAGAGIARQQKPPSFESLPDWSGIWQMQGGTIFDAATVEPKGGRSGDAFVRERPPYTPEFEKIYSQNIQKIADGRLAGSREHVRHGRTDFRER